MGSYVLALPDLPPEYLCPWSSSKVRLASSAAPAAGGVNEATVDHAVSSTRTSKSGALHKSLTLRAVPLPNLLIPCFLLKSLLLCAMGGVFLGAFRCRCIRLSLGSFDAEVSLMSHAG